MKFIRPIFPVFVSAMLAGCGGAASNPGGGGTGGTGGGGGMTGSGTGTGGNAAPLLPADAQVATYISLGDSISDEGGIGPFFYDLLNADLATKFPGLTFVHVAQQGAITDVFSDGQPMDVPLLKTQVDGLGSSYAGDIIITITIGGNDLNAHALQAISNTDASLRAEFDAHLAAELGELTTPGRLGSGKVYVVVANIYDFTDGQGDFATVMCGPGVNISPMAVALGFGNWNGVLADNTSKVAGGLYDMHADFMGHGYNNTDPTQVWYDAASCIHPNAVGHDAIRKGIYKILTGDSL